MTRTTERWIWIGVVAFLLLIGIAMLLTPAGRMLAMCQGMMGGGMMNDGMMQDGGMRPNPPPNDR